MKTGYGHSLIVQLTACSFFQWRNLSIRIKSSYWNLRPQYLDHSIDLFIDSTPSTTFLPTQLIRIASCGAEFESDIRLDFAAVPAASMSRSKLANMNLTLLPQECLQQISLIFFKINRQYRPNHNISIIIHFYRERKE